MPQSKLPRRDLVELLERLRELPRRLLSGGSRSDGALGTFVGVYTPTVLTILGVILYLRFGWVVGHAGIWGTLAIVILANAITFATTLALSAVATNSWWESAAPTS